MAWVQADMSGRVLCVVEDERFVGDGFVEVDLPEGFDVPTAKLGDWRLEDGALVEDDAQSEAEAAEEERATAIAEGSAAFFADGGKETMERSIEEAAASGGADPQVAVLARLLAPSVDFASVTATDVVAIPDYIPEWRDCVGKTLPQNSPVKHNGTIYRTSQRVLVQDIYPPDVAGESQYYPIEVAPDGVIVYRPCHGEYDMVRAGETRHWPDADGPVYRAKVDAAYDPGTRPDYWELVGGDA